MKFAFSSLIAVSFVSVAQAQQAAIPDYLRGLAKSDYGCEVLLCLADPRGPRTEAPCVPPINRLMRDLAKGRSFPTCNLATGPNGRSYATPAWRPYDACPAGTTQLEAGQYAELAGPLTTPPATRSGAASLYTSAAVGMTYAGVGDGSGYGYGGWENPDPVKVCVAGYRGTRPYWSDGGYYSVSTYDTVYIQNAAPGLAIDVYIDDALWQTVRW